MVNLQKSLITLSNIKLSVKHINICADSPEGKPNKSKDIFDIARL